MTEANDPRSSASDSSPSATGDEFPPARVLVVDDEPSVVDVFQEFLSGEGYELSVATSGEEALRVLPDARPDVILTDINLPGISGLEVMRFAKGLDPEVAVIVVTGYASASTAIEALRQGAYDYVTKPFELDEVHQIVERAIANRRLKAINRRLVQELREKNERLERHETELREKVRLATWQMTALYEIGKEIGASLELAPRLQLICAKAAELTGAQGAVVYLRNGETERYAPEAAWGATLPPREERSLLLPEGPGPLERAVHGEVCAARAAIRSLASSRAFPGSPSSPCSRSRSRPRWRPPACWS